MENSKGGGQAEAGEFAEYAAALEKHNWPLPLGTMTAFGTVESVGYRDGERWYMVVMDGLVSLFAASDLEPNPTPITQGEPK